MDPDIDDGIFGDIWRRYAFDFLRVKSCEARERELEPVYSIGPCVPGERQPQFATLLDITNPAPSADAKDIDAGGTFDFQTEHVATAAPVPGDLCGHPTGGDGDNQAGLLFFTVVRDLLNYIVPEMAPSSKNAGLMAISMVDIRGFDIKAQRVTAALENFDGSAQEKVHVLSPTSLSCSELRSLRCWRRAQTMEYSAGFDVQQGSKAILQELLSALLRARSAAGPVDHYIVQQTAEDRDAKIAVLILLEARGIVERLTGTDSVWRLVDDGAKLIQVNEVLEMKGPALAPRTGLERSELTTFELLTELLADGWQCRPWFPKKRGNKPDAWCEGREKVFWVKNKQRTLTPMYLIALITAAGGDDKCKEVPHFQTAAFYACLVKGEKYIPQQKDGFHFEDEDQAKKDLLEPAADSDSDSDSSSSSSSAPAPAPVAVSPSDSDSDSSDSSANSTTSPPVAEQKQKKDAGNDDGGGPPRAAGTGGNRDGGRGRRGRGPEEVAGDGDEETPFTQHETHIWRGFRFTQTYSKDGSVEGWEVKCPLDHHRGDGPPCRRRRGIAKFGGPAECERRLKWWCLQGQFAPNRLSHRDQPEVADMATVPSLAALETFEAQPPEPPTGGENTADLGAEPAAPVSKRARRTK